MEQITTTSARIKEEAKRLGFDECGIARAERLGDEEAHLREWLDKGMHGEMGYMANHFEKRLDPTKLVDEAQSVISVLLNYYPSRKQNDPKAPVISKYAYGVDYHFVIKERLNQLLEFINREIGSASGRPFVDSAPVLDRTWARKAGLGWIGKNSCLISPKHGSFVFIGELIIDMKLEYDQPFEKKHCGSCSRCMDNCPTGAIVAPGIVDARKCISYLTIECRDDIDPCFKGKMKNRVYGCDICQDVCPWNRKCMPHAVPEFEPKEELIELTHEQWKKMTKEDFSRIFSKSAVKRGRYKGLRRNIDFLGDD